MCTIDHGLQHTNVRFMAEIIQDIAQTNSSNQGCVRSAVGTNLTGCALTYALKGWLSGRLLKAATSYGLDVQASGHRKHTCRLVEFVGHQYRRMWYAATCNMSH